MTKDNQDFKQLDELAQWADEKNLLFRATVHELVAAFKAERLRSSLPEGVVNAIRSFTYSDGQPRVWNDNDKGMYSDRRDFVEYNLANNRPIYSVVNSKGEAFKVGDVADSAPIRKPCPTIARFEIEQPTNRLVAWYDVGGFDSVDNLRKPLPSFSFTCNGDNVTVTDGTQIVHGALLINSPHIVAHEARFASKSHNSKRVWFSTEEAAREHIRLNTKSFSLNDVKECFNEPTEFKGNTYHRAMSCEQIIAALNDKIKV